MKERTTPTTEEFNAYLALNPKASNQDIADHFGIAKSTAASLKSKIKHGKRREFSDGRPVLFKKALKPEDPDWWNYTTKCHPELMNLVGDKYTIKPIVLKTLKWLRKTYPDQSPAIQAQIRAFYRNFSKAAQPAPMMSWWEFMKVSQGLIKMCKNGAEEFANTENTVLTNTEPKTKQKAEDIIKARSEEFKGILKKDSQTEAKEVLGEFEKEMHEMIWTARGKVPEKKVPQTHHTVSKKQS